MNPLIHYTTYQEVRATLGVSTTELTDATLALDLYATVLDMELDAVNPLVITQFDRITAIEAPATPTPLEAKFAASVRIFAAYALAKHLVSTLPLFSVKQLEDGKANFDRFDDAYADLKEDIEAMYMNFRARVGLLLSQLETTPVVLPEPVSLITSVTAPLAVDPVTGAT